MKHTTISTQLEAQAARNVSRRPRKPLSPEALAAKARLAEATARLRANGGMAASVLERSNTPRLLSDEEIAAEAADLEDAMLDDEYHARGQW